MNFYNRKSFYPFLVNFRSLRMIGKKTNNQPIPPKKKKNVTMENFFRQPSEKRTKLATLKLNLIPKNTNTTVSETNSSSRSNKSGNLSARSLKSPKQISGKRGNSLINSMNSMGSSIKRKKSSFGQFIGKLLTSPRNSTTKSNSSSNPKLDFSSQYDEFKDVKMPSIIGKEKKKNLTY